MRPWSLLSHPVRWFSGLSLATQFLATCAIVLCGAMAILGEWIEREVAAVTLKSAAVSSSVFLDAFIEPAVQGLIGSYLPQESRDHLDRAIAQKPLDGRLVAVKVWLLDGMIVYATRKELEGRMFPVDEVARAAKGEVVASYGDLTEPESVFEAQTGKPLIEIYAPLYRTGTNEVIAVGEYYEDAPWLGVELRRAQQATWFVVGVTTAALLGLLFVIVRRGSITIERQRAELQQRVRDARLLADQNEELRLVADVARVEANESNEQLISRVGSDLHDGPIQLLSMLMLKLSAADAGASGRSGGDASGDRTALVAITREVIDELRNLSTGLSLPEIDRAPLREALQLAVSRHEDVTGARVALMIESLPDEIPHALKICAYRVVQEALMNSYKHAGCMNPEVSVFVDKNDLLIVVADDGGGFQPDTVSENGRQKLGLAGIRNRVRAFRGTLDIASLPGEGTQLVVRLPLQP